jgi:hypothetical protein
MNSFVVEVWKKFDLDTYKLSVVFKPNKVLTRQKILPGESKNSIVDGLSRNLKSRYGERNRFQEPSLELSSQAT